MVDEEIKMLTNEELDSFVGDSLKLYLQEMKEFPLLSDEEEYNLFLEYSKGSIKAYHKLVNCNQRLIISVAYKYKNRISHMQFLDIIQEGNIGLIKAIERYDISRGNKFSTYAVNWIRQAISRSIDNSDEEIRIPEHLKNAIKNYKKLLEDFEKENKPIPSDKKLCEILGITQNALGKIRNILSTRMVSINQTIDDDNKTELGNLIEDTRSSYDEKIMDKMVELQIFVVLKEILSPTEYYIIYNRILSDEKKSFDEISACIGITKERVRQLEKTILQKIKPYFENNYEKLGKVYRRIVEKFKYPVEKVDIEPVDPQKIMLYLYVKGDLDLIKQNALYLKMFSKYNLTLEERAKELNISSEELEDIEKEIQDVINKKMLKINKYRKFKNEMLKTHGKNIFNLALKDKENIIDYSYLNERYASLSFAEIVSLFGNDYLNLTVSEQKLLERFFDKKDYDILPYYQIEQEVNLLKYGYKHSDKSVPLNKLYQTYLDNIEEFSEDKRLYLECFIFNKRDKREFLDKYSLKDLRRLRFYLINKLEKMYYQIPNFTVLQFTKEKYLKIKRLYEGRIPIDKEKILDLYYGVINRSYSISEMADIFQVDYITMHQKLRDARDTALALYTKKKSIKLNIDKDIYVPYILDRKYEFTDEAREILELYIIDELSYDEIATYFEDTYNTKLTKARISNIITENIRRIDFYRFHIIEPHYEVKDTIDKFYEAYKDNFNDEDKQIINLRFIQDIPTDKISSDYGFSKEVVRRIVTKFNKLYTNFLVNEVKVYDSDIVSELKKSKVDEILNERQKRRLSLTYGIKNEYNTSGEKYSPTQIINIMDISMNIYYHEYYDALSKIKQRKLGLLRGECAFMEKDEVIKALEDEHLPISEKEREIISSLYEINGFEYKTLDELALIYGDTANSIKRRCQRAFVSINKYLNGEIEGIINYDKDIVPNLRYFSKSERILLTEKYKNGLSFEKVAKKYKITFDRVVNIYNRLQIMLTEIISNPDFKKIDFDMCEKAFDSDDLPFYGDKELARNIFDDFFAMNSFIRMPMTEIINKYNLNIKPNAVSNLLGLFILSAYKYNEGYRKDKCFTYEEIKSYYDEHCNEMTVIRKRFYMKYFKRKQESTSSISSLVNHVILFDLIREKNPDSFKIATTNKEEVVKILQKYSNCICKRTKESLMVLFDISEKALMNGKDINHVYRLLNKLDKKLSYNKPEMLVLKKD